MQWSAIVRVLRFLIEGLLQIVYRIAWAAFWAQGLAFVTLALVSLSAGSSPWAIAVRPSALILGAIFVAGGLLLLAVSLKSRVTAAVANPEEPAWTSRSALLCASLVALSAAAIVASRELLSLWREIVVLLDRAGLFREIPGGGAGSGLVLAPLMAILYTPIVSALSAAALVALPVLLAIALAAKSPRFDWLFTSTVICCAVLVGAGLVAAGLFERLSTLATPTLLRGGDPTGAQVVEELKRASEVLLRSGRAQALVLLGHLAWLPFMLMRSSDAGNLTLEEELENEPSGSGDERAAVS
jgi:hypothetical protein